MAAPFVIRSETNGREQNEDSVLAFRILPGLDQPPIFVLAVADGMGGHAHGEKISREALKRLSVLLFEQLSVHPNLNQHAKPEPPSSEELANILWGAIEETNGYLQRIISANRWGLAGSTAVVALIAQGTAVVSNLGDSPLFHYRAADRSLKKVTEDHTVANVLLRNRLISPEMARVHEGRSRLEYFFGREGLPSERPLYEVHLAPGDDLLLCSDGISGKLEEAKIGAILAEEGASLEQKAERLIEAALAVGETDNQTLIIWHHYGSGDARSTVQLPELPMNKTVQLEAPQRDLLRPAGDNTADDKAETDR